MLVVTVELWPYGLEDEKVVLAGATIANRGRDEQGFSYRAELRERGDEALQIMPREQVVDIAGYDRRQSVWNLVRDVLVTASREDETPVSPREHHDAE